MHTSSLSTSADLVDQQHSSPLLLGLRRFLTVCSTCCCRDRLDQEQQRVAWYPGSNERMAAAKKRIPNLQELGKPAVPEPGTSTTDSSQPNGHADPRGLSKTSPWLLSTGLTPEQVQLRGLITADGSIVMHACRGTISLKSQMLL